MKLFVILAALAGLSSMAHADLFSMGTEVAIPKVSLDKKVKEARSPELTIGTSPAVKATHDNVQPWVAKSRKWTVLDLKKGQYISRLVLVNKHQTAQLSIDVDNVQLSKVTVDKGTILDARERSVNVITFGDKHTNLAFLAKIQD